MQPTNDAVTNTFHLLAETVREFCARQNRCLGAKLKPELYRRYGFSERQLGFIKFGEFLRAAESAGYIRLTRSHGGDIEVWPAYSESPTVATASPAHLLDPPSLPFPEKSAWVASPSATGFTRVRQDLWNAFNSYAENWVYDQANDIAYKTSDQSAAVAASVPRLSPNLLRIPPGRDRVLDWMKSFASNVQDQQAKERLLGILQGDSGPYHFHEFIATDLRQQKAWRRYRLQRVIEAIKAWADVNNARPKNITEHIDRGQKPYWSVPTAPPTLRSPVQVSPTTENWPMSLSPRLSALIDELINELLRLRGMIEVLGAKR